MGLAFCQAQPSRQMSLSERFVRHLRRSAAREGRHGDGDIAGSPVNERIGDVLFAGGGEGVDYVKHTGPVAAAEVAGEVLWPLIEQGLEGGLVAFGEIHQVDVITHAGAFMFWPVAARNLELFAASDGHLRQGGEEVVWDAEGSSPIWPVEWAPMGLK